MSGLFQRIARRRGGDPDETTTAAAAAPVGTPAATGSDGSARPTRYIGAPAPSATQETPSTDDLPAPAAEQDPTAADAPPDQPTALFPLAEQPTEAHPPLSETGVGTALTAPVAAAAAPAEGQPSPGGEASADADAQASAQEPAERRPGFRERGRMRRRLRYLRRLRELQVRDLGGLAFDLRRFERKRDDLVAQKIDQIRACDDEVSALETALEERRDVRDVRMPGIGGTCPRCFSIYGSSDRFCAHCGAALGGLAQGPAQVAAAPALASPAPLPANEQPARSEPQQLAPAAPAAIAAPPPLPAPHESTPPPQ